MKLEKTKLDEAVEAQKGPKFGNIHDEKETPPEKPEGADGRLKLLAAAIFVVIVFITIKGYLTNGSLVNKAAEQQKLFDKVKAEALTYGITEDEEGEIVFPDLEPEKETGNSDDEQSIENRNKKVLDEFTSLLLNWEGKSGYDKVRQTLIHDWGFTEDGGLLKSFMPESTADLDINMKLPADRNGSPKYTTFVLSDDGKNISYFLLCEVRTTKDGSSGYADATIGIQITINEDKSLSNVVAQTLS